MANEVLHKQGTVVNWKNSGGTAAITLASIANNAARQGAKADLGATRARRYAPRLTIETGTAPTAGNVIELWWAASPNATAGTENPAGASGTDAAYKAGEEDEWKVQLQYLGALVVTNDGNTVQVQILPTFEPPTRYGMPVVVNKSGQSFNASNTNHEVALIPIVDEVQ